MQILYCSIWWDPSFNPIQCNPVICMNDGELHLPMPLQNWPKHSINKHNIISTLWMASPSLTPAWWMTCKCMVCDWLCWWQTWWDVHHVHSLLHMTYFLLGKGSRSNQPQCHVCIRHQGWSADHPWSRMLTELLPITPMMCPHKRSVHPINWQRAPYTMYLKEIELRVKEVTDAYVISSFKIEKCVLK